MSDAFTCRCCGATSRHPERKAAGETLAELLIDRRMSTFEAGHLTGLRPEELEGVIHGSTAIDDRIAEHLAKLGPPAKFWTGAKDMSEGIPE